MNRKKQKLQKTLVIGKKSFLGSYFFEAYQNEYPDTIGTDYKAKESSFKLDLREPNLAPLNIKPKEYSFALIAAAQPNISQCEKDPEMSYQCNVEGPLSLCKQLREKNIFPILFSTDYVFDGKRGNYTEESEVNPINTYGKQKAELERRIPLVCGKQYLILRLSKVFGMKKGDQTLLDEMASLLKSGKRIKAAIDQIFCPIFIEDVMNSVFKLQQMGCTGLYHLCGSEVWRRYDIATKIAANLLVPLQQVEKISLNDLGLNRPNNTAMNNHKLVSLLKLSQKKLSKCIEELTKQHF